MQITLATLAPPFRISECSLLWGTGGANHCQQIVQATWEVDLKVSDFLHPICRAFQRLFLSLFHLN